MRKYWTSPGPSILQRTSRNGIPQSSYDTSFDGCGRPNNNGRMGVALEEILINSYKSIFKCHIIHCQTCLNFPKTVKVIPIFSIQRLGRYWVKTAITNFAKTDGAQTISLTDSTTLPGVTRHAKMYCVISPGRKRSAITWARHRPHLLLAFNEESISPPARWKRPASKDQNTGFRPFKHQSLNWIEGLTKESKYW